MVGPDAGEVIQGVAIAVKLGATKAQFDATIGIHPTAAEEFVTMREKSVLGPFLARRASWHSIRSVWADAAMPQFPPLQENIHVDVCIVGAGISGLTTAYAAREGRPAGRGARRRPGGGRHDAADHRAHLQHARRRYFEIEKLHGREGARLAADSHTAAIDRIETIVQAGTHRLRLRAPRRLPVPRRRRRAARRSSTNSTRRAAPGCARWSSSRARPMRRSTPVRACAFRTRRSSIR